MCIMKFSVIFLVSLLASFTYASKFLFLPLHGEGSHYFVVRSVANELIKRGHHVTILVDNRFEVEVKEDGKLYGFNVERFQSNFTMSEHRVLLQNVTSAGLRGEYLAFMVELMGTGYVHRQVSECDGLFSDEKLMVQLKEANFDVAIQDPNLYCPFVQYFGIPFVMLNPSMGIPSLTLLENRVPYNPSFMPEICTGLNHKMTFQERLQNTAYLLLIGFIVKAINNPYQSLQEKYNLQDISLLYADAEMWLINGHFAFEFPRPLLPNTAMVGGLTTIPAKPLSLEWETYLQSAGKDGVVLFSMGSYATGIDENVASIFAGAFAQIPQKVIWKLNGKPAVAVSPNVKVVDWIPQNDLLAHPQIKVFVYHCGLNGIWEAVYHGVPMVGVPLFGDQFDNAQRIVSRGMGVKVDIATLTSDELAEAIRTVINNRSFKSNATRISSIFNDRRRTPTEEAADWLEYVIRHGGAKHLRSAALDLNIFQYLLLDVIAVLSITLLTAVTMLICCCRLCFRGCRKVCGKSSKVKKE